MDREKKQMQYKFIVIESNTEVRKIQAYSRDSDDQYGWCGKHMWRNLGTWTYEVDSPRSCEA